MNSENIFGSRVKELRIKNNLTQPQLGKEIGLSKQAINDIEHGRRETTVSKVILLARLFNTTVEYLTGETDNISRTEKNSVIENLFSNETVFCLSKRLKELRTKKQSTIQEVGKETLLGTLRYKHIENAESNPPATYICALADYFNVSTDYLLGRTDNPKINK